MDSAKNTINKKLTQPISSVEDVFKNSSKKMLEFVYNTISTRSDLDINPLSIFEAFFGAILVEEPNPTYDIYDVYERVCQFLNLNQTYTTFAGIENIKKQQEYNGSILALAKAGAVILSSTEYPDFAQELQEMLTSFVVLIGTNVETSSNVIDKLIENSVPRFAQTIEENVTVASISVPLTPSSSNASNGIVVESKGWTSDNKEYTTISFGALIKNTNKEMIARDIDVTISLYDKSGNLLDNFESVIDAINPGDTIGFGENYCGHYLEVSNIELTVGHSRFRDVTGFEEKEKLTTEYISTRINFNSQIISYSLKNDKLFSYNFGSAYLILKDELGNIIGGSSCSTYRLHPNSKVILEFNVGQELEFTDKEIYLDINRY